MKNYLKGINSKTKFVLSGKSQNKTYNYSLTDLLKNVDPDKIHRVINSSPPLGKEIW